MSKFNRISAIALCVTTVLATASCGSSTLSIPDEFCRTPTEKSALSPLIPEGENLQQKYKETQARTGAFCTLKVDGHQVLFITIQKYDRKPDPVDWEIVASTYKNAAKRKVSFAGGAVIGSDRGVVQATCDSTSTYMSFAIDFRGDRVEDSAQGYKKLQRFIDDFVPRQTKRYECTT
ncbi:hypothetical protein [Streptomyces sp. NPDC018693]|uniref:hypothetical protein n=1 Tax=unclassified Streptomyces TaxID=2593676 RepID=UPI0037A75C9E